MARQPIFRDTYSQTVAATTQTDDYTVKQNRGPVVAIRLATSGAAANDRLTILADSDTLLANEPLEAYEVGNGSADMNVELPCYIQPGGSVQITFNGANNSQINYITFIYDINR